jgi:SET domain-containing protein
MLHPNIAVVENEVIHGKGLIATGIIKAGEMISRLTPNRPVYPIKEVLTWSQEEQDNLLIYGYQLDDEYIVLEAEPDRYMNHSCDPNTWWIDSDTMIARRDILPGEEITYDYATTEITIPFEMPCGCGTAICRKKVTNLDYLDLNWQARFADYLPAHTRKAIAAARAKENQ